MTNLVRSTNARLKELMDQETDLTRPLVAEIVGMSRAAVDMWLRPPGTTNWRPMQERYLRLLEFELGYRRPRFTRLQRGFVMGPLKINDLLWCIVAKGQAQALSDDNRVQVVDLCGSHAHLSNGVIIDTTTLQGALTETVRENFGAVKDDQTPEDVPFPERWKPRIVEREVAYPARCWRTKEDWEEHVETQRAWNKLASRIQTTSVENMEAFKVDDIVAAELALFGDVQP